MSFSLVASLASLITSVLTWIGLPGLFALMVVESFGVPPLPSEVILPFTGFLVAEGTFSFGPAVAVAVAGAVVGAYIAYAIGRWWRHRITEIGFGRLRLEEKHLARMDRFFRRRGELTVAVARLIPIARAYISYPAGTAEMEPARFGVFTTIGQIPFTVALIYAGLVLRHDWNALIPYFDLLSYPLIAVVAFLVLLIVLETMGVLAPGWPPRRAPRAPAPTTDRPASPPPGSGSP